MGLLCLNLIESIILICFGFYGMMEITWKLINLIHNWNEQERLEPK